MPKEPAYAREVLELYRDGKSLVMIAAITGKGVKTVSRQISCLRQLGHALPYRRPRRSRQDDQPVPREQPGDFLPKLVILDKEAARPVQPCFDVDEAGDDRICTYLLRTRHEGGPLTCQNPIAGRGSYCRVHAAECLDTSPRKRLTAASYDSRKVAAGRFGSMGDFL